MMKSIVEEIIRTTRDTELLLQTERDFLFLKPSIDEWSVLECLTHLVLVEESVLNDVLLQPFVGEGPIQTFEVSKLKHLLINKRDVKLDAPDLFVARGQFVDARFAFDRLVIVRDGVMRLLSGDAGKFDGYLFRHPRLGNMTRLDWVWFCIAHADRHVMQMRDVLDKMAKI